jgi:hypothetical protein
VTILEKIYLPSEKSRISLVLTEAVFCLAFLFNILARLSDTIPGQFQIFIFQYFSLFTLQSLFLRLRRKEGDDRLHGVIEYRDGVPSIVRINLKNQNVPFFQTFQLSGNAGRHCLLPSLRLSFRYVETSACLFLLTSEQFAMESIHGFFKVVHSTVTRIHADIESQGRTQSTYIPEVTQCLSPRSNRDPPTPLPQASVSPLNQRGDTLACG